MTEPTGGVWAVNPVNAWVEVVGEDAPICAMLWPTDLRSEEETFANAQLITAAKDLLASVIELLEPLERASAEMVREGKALNEAGEAAFDRARAAIAKARGVA